MLTRQESLHAQMPSAARRIPKLTMFVQSSAVVLKHSSLSATCNYPEATWQSQGRGRPEAKWCTELAEPHLGHGSSASPSPLVGWRPPAPDGSAPVAQCPARGVPMISTPSKPSIPCRGQLCTNAPGTPSPLPQPVQSSAGLLTGCCKHQVAPSACNSEAWVCTSNILTNATCKWGCLCTMA